MFLNIYLIQVLHQAGDTFIYYTVCEILFYCSWNDILGKDKEYEISSSLGFLCICWLKMSRESFGKVINIKYMSTYLAYQQMFEQYVL